ncbi:MAG: hypothetical protein AVDCRST_MAG11-3814, partial [uncultured Gemmatimonadaceae bacterium]
VRRPSRRPPVLDRQRLLPAGAPHVRRPRARAIRRPARGAPRRLRPRAESRGPWGVGARFVGGVCSRRL